MNDQFERVAEAFSRKAAVYDGFGENHINLQRMRHKVYAHIGRWIRPPGRLLELKAGTGLDAVALAQQRDSCSSRGSTLSNLLFYGVAGAAGVSGRF